MFSHLQIAKELLAHPNFDMINLRSALKNAVKKQHYAMIWLLLMQTKSKVDLMSLRAAQYGDAVCLELIIAKVSNNCINFCEKSHFYINLKKLYPKRYNISDTKFECKN